MTIQLRKAMTEAGPDAVQTVRLRLIEASENALIDSNVRCLLYAALSTATTDRTLGDDVDPFLASAILSALREDPDAVLGVAEELMDTGDETGDELVSALGRELLIAHCLLALTIHQAKTTLEDFQSLADWPSS